MQREELETVHQHRVLVELHRKASKGGKRMSRAWSMHLLT